MKINRIQPLFNIVFFLVISQLSVAQTALESLVSAEKAFAKMSEETDTKNAFVHFLGDSSIIFRPGPVPGKAFWEASEAANDLLCWEPSFADVSAAGDMGYTLGPFEYRADRFENEKIGTGHFVSVWKKEKDGSWKVAIDVGAGHDPVPRKSFTTSAIPPKAAEEKTAAAAKAELLQTEQAFCAALDKNGPSVYYNWLSSEAKVLRRFTPPGFTKETIKAALEAPGKQFSFQPIRAEVAASGDLGYVYGSGTALIPKVEKPAYYLRIWKKEDGRNWKIVLDIALATK
jgi:ketosteroid isomerase-like protein